MVVAQKFGYSWNFVSNYFVVLHCDPPRAAGRIQVSVGSSLGSEKWEVPDRPSIPRPVWKHEVSQRAHVTF